MSLSKDAITKWTSKDKIMVEFLGPKGSKVVREFQLGHILGNDDMITGAAHYILKFLLCIGLIIFIVVFLMTVAHFSSKLKMKMMPDSVDSEKRTIGDSYSQVSDTIDFNKMDAKDVNEPVKIQQTPQEPIFIDSAVAVPKNNSIFIKKITK